VGYWELATRLELAALAGDWDDVRRLVPLLRASAEAEWMLASTANNLDLIAESLQSPSGQLELERATRDLLHHPEAHHA
jgi:hypothetical protein